MTRKKRRPVHGHNEALGISWSGDGGREFGEEYERMSPEERKSFRAALSEICHRSHRKQAPRKKE